MRSATAVTARHC